MYNRGGSSSSYGGGMHGRSNQSHPSYAQHTTTTCTPVSRPLSSRTHPHRKQRGTKSRAAILQVQPTSAAMRMVSVGRRAVTAAAAVQRKLSRILAMHGRSQNQDRRRGQRRKRSAYVRLVARRFCHEKGSAAYVILEHAFVFAFSTPVDSKDL